MTPDAGIRQIRDGQCLILRPLVPYAGRKARFTDPFTFRPLGKRVELRGKSRRENP